MKIVHIVIVGPYTEGMTYQENLLPVCHAKQGHEVTVIANCTFWDKDTIKSTEATEKKIDTNFKLIRLPFVFVLHSYITEKLRWMHGLYETLRKEKPDFIFLHDVATVSTGQIEKYLEESPSTVLVVDSHSTFLNSAHGWISKKILHGIIYKYSAQKIYKFAKSIYYIEPETKEFLQECYGFPLDKMKFLSLGGTTLHDEDYRRVREKVRRRYAIPEGTTVFLHSGKLDATKRTVELPEAFLHRKHKNDTALYIIGETSNRERRMKIEQLASLDQTIHLLGWKPGEELHDFLCAADVYVQPGEPSATLQVAACCRCGIVARDFACYTEVFGDAEFLFSQEEDLYVFLDVLCASKDKINTLRETTYEKAKQYLDYAVQAEEILAGN